MDLDAVTRLSRLHGKLSWESEKRVGDATHIHSRMRVRERESIGFALRRFKKLLERSGFQKELRKRRHYEKPCEVRRRAKLRKERALRKGASVRPPR
jgi:small subunit ribosomal protein S21